MPFDALFREGQIGAMRLRNRIIAGPMERNLANRDGSITQRYIDYLVERARGGVGLIIVESTYVDPRGMGQLYQLGAHGDHVIPGLRRLAEAVHGAGGKIGLELHFGGRQTPAYNSGRQPLGPSAVRCETMRVVPTPREMTEEDIEEITAAFAAAGRRTVEAGLDLIELHGAHGYLLGAFLSPFTNKRTDKYGGSLEKRARFPLEVLGAVRGVVRAGFPIAYRLSAEEFVEGGLTVKETGQFASMLEGAGVDLIDVSGGIYESFPMMIQGPAAPKAGFLRYAKIIKQAVRAVPVSVAQRLNDPEIANRVLEREGLDFVTLARALHADPDWPRKVRENRLSEIVPCIACYHCTNQLTANEPVRCVSNTGSGRERVGRPVAIPQSRNVVVVGGGLAGMEAARSLASFGHPVTLFEKTSELGGQIRYSSEVAPDYKNLVTYLSHQLSLLKVDVRLNTTMDYAMLEKMAPDAIVIATGAGPGMRTCPVLGQARVFDLFSAFERREDWEGRVVVVGGDAAGCALALYVAGRGAEVHVVEPSNGLAEDRKPPARNFLIQTLGRLPTVHIHLESTAEEIGPHYVLRQHHGRFDRIEGVESVIFGGRVANNSLYEEVVMRNPHIEIYAIGDFLIRTSASMEIKGQSVFPAS